MSKGLISIGGVKKVMLTPEQVVKARSFSPTAKDYYYRLSMEEVADGVGFSTNGQEKVIFQNTNAHIALFNAIDKYFDGTSPEKTVATDKFVDVPEDAKFKKVWGFFSTYAHGRNLTREQNGRQVGFSTIPLVILGKRQLVDAQGNIVQEAVGESPAGIVDGMVNRGIFTEIANVELGADDDVVVS